MGLTDNILWRLAVLGGSGGGSPQPDPGPGPAPDPGGDDFVVDGKTRFYMDFDNPLFTPEVDIHMTLLGSRTGSVLNVDWGDESNQEVYVFESQEVQKVLHHAYAKRKAYTITMWVDATDKIAANNWECVEFVNGPQRRNGNAFGYVDNVTSPRLLTGSQALRRLVIGRHFAVGTRGFMYCTNLTKVHGGYGSNMAYASVFGQYAFLGCFSLCDVTYNDAVERAPDFAYQYCYGIRHATDVLKGQFSYAYMSIGSYAFDACSGLIDADIPAGIVRVFDYAFSNCPMLYRATFPESVNSIGSNVFGSNSGMHEIICENATPPTLAGKLVTYMYAFQYRNCKIVVPRGSLEAYQTATNWAQYADYMVEADT